MATYVCRRFPSVGTFEFTASFAEASSPIMVRFEGHDEWQPVPFQVADCRHDRRVCEQKIAEYFR